jgi:hypothetical protein
MQQVFTFVAKIVRGREANLQAFLASLQSGQPNHGKLPLAKFANLHYASLLIARDPSGRFPEYLVFENNIDGTIDAYIEQLCSKASEALDAMFSDCAGYGAAAPSGAPPDIPRLRKFLRASVTLPNAAFVGNVGRTVQRIRDEKKLIDDLENTVDTLLRTLPNPASQNLYDSARSATARGNAWAFQPMRRLSVSEMLRRRLSAWAEIPTLLLELFLPPFAVILIVRRIRGSMPPLLVMLGLLFTPLLATATILRIHEITDTPDESPLDPSFLLRVTANEDQRQGQNHFASVSVVKPGIFRRTVLRVVLSVIGRVAAASDNGTLGKLDNIHFAQWVLLDGGRRLMFLTNYDGSWENYLDDFIDRASNGLTAIWSNTVGFPRASWLTQGGARKERQFKNSARRTQLQPALWYNAYEGLTVTSIQNNSEVRNGLATPPHGAAVGTWLRRL